MRAGGAIKQIVKIAIAAVRLELDERCLIIRRVKSAPIIDELWWGDNQLVRLALCGLSARQGKPRGALHDNFGFDIVCDGDGQRFH